MNNVANKYPNPDDVLIPDLDEISADQAFYLSWLAQHARLWLVVLAEGVIIILLLAGLVLQTVKYQPTQEYVSLAAGGLPVTWNDNGNVVFDDVEYVPARMRRVVEDFVENRYAYDFQNIQKINAALRLMEPEARQIEYEKFESLNPRTTIMDSKLKVRLAVGYNEMQVVPQGRGVFRVKLEGDALINDAFNHPDPKNPLARPVTIDLVVETVRSSTSNPLGYRIISTGKDII